MNARASFLIMANIFYAFALFGGDLSNAEQEKLKKTFTKGQSFFLIQPYLEGDVKGLHIYNVRPVATPEFVPSWRDVVNPERRLLRGDKVIVQSVDTNGNYLELRIKAVERRSAHATAGQRYLMTAIGGLPGMAAGQGEYSLQPQSKLRFFGKSATDIEFLISKFLSAEPPTIDLQPGMSPNEVKAVLGDPNEIVNFGNKKTFKYPDKDIVFIDDKLADMIFKDSGSKKQ
jgi:hypothetical protein